MTPLLLTPADNLEWALGGILYSCPCTCNMVAAMPSAYILPAEHSIAASAIDVSDCVQACHEQSLFLWAQRDIHPVRESHTQAGLTLRTRMICASSEWESYEAGGSHMTEEKCSPMTPLEGLHAHATRLRRVSDEGYRL